MKNMRTIIGVMGLLLCVASLDGANGARSGGSHVMPTSQNPGTIINQHAVNLGITVSMYEEALIKLGILRAADLKTEIRASYVPRVLLERAQVMGLDLLTYLRTLDDDILGVLAQESDQDADNKYARAENTMHRGARKVRSRAQEKSRKTLSKVRDRKAKAHAKKRAIAQKEKSKSQAQDDDNKTFICPLCHETMKLSEAARLSCGHLVHMPCIVHRFCARGSLTLVVNGCVLGFIPRVYAGCPVCSAEFKKADLDAIEVSARKQYASGAVYENQVLIPEIEKLIRNQRDELTDDAFKTFVVDLLRVYVTPKENNARTMSEIDVWVTGLLARADKDAVNREIARKVYVSYKAYADYPRCLRSLIEMLDRR